MAENTSLPWVVDCSFAMALCLPDEASEEVSIFFREVLSNPIQDMYVPSLWICETGNVLLSAVKSGRLSPLQQQEAVAILQAINPQTKFTDLNSVDRILNLGSQYSLSFYDAIYLDLAIQNSAGLATLDNKLLEAAISASIEVDWRIGS